MQVVICQQLLKRYWLVFHLSLFISKSFETMSFLMQFHNVQLGSKIIILTSFTKSMARLNYSSLIIVFIVLQCFKYLQLIVRINVFGAVKITLQFLKLNTIIIIQISNALHNIYSVCVEVLMYSSSNMIFLMVSAMFCWNLDGFNSLQLLLLHFVFKRSMNEYTWKFYLNIICYRAHDMIVF